jgi:hypothetical protein
VQVGAPDETVTGHAGVLAVSELVSRLAVIDTLNDFVGAVRQRDRGLSAGGFLVALAHMLGIGFFSDLDRLRADEVAQTLSAASTPGRPDGDPAVPDSRPDQPIPSGEPVLLLDQDRRLWDRLLIRRGLAALDRAEALGGGPYTLQAAIAACHARALRAKETDWSQMAALYQVLDYVSPSPVVELARRRDSRSPGRSRPSGPCRTTPSYPPYAVTCSPSSAGTTRRGESSTARRASPAMPASGRCSSAAPPNPRPPLPADRPHSEDAAVASTRTDADRGQTCRCRTAACVCRSSNHDCSMHSCANGLTGR